MTTATERRPRKLLVKHLMKKKDWRSDGWQFTCTCHFRTERHVEEADAREELRQHIREVNRG